MSTLSVANLSDGTDTCGADIIVHNTPKVWGAIDIPGSAPTLRDGFGISSLTDAGVGTTDVNFTTAFTAATDFAPLATNTWSSQARGIFVGAQSASQGRVIVRENGGSTSDQEFGFAALGEFAP